MLVEAFEQHEEDWLAELYPSEIDDVETKEFEFSDAPLFCALDWIEPLRLTVPSDIKLPNIEETEMAERCLHRQCRK